MAPDVRAVVGSEARRVFELESVLGIEKEPLKDPDTRLQLQNSLRFVLRYQTVTSLI